MKKLIISALTLLIVSCNNQQKPAPKGNMTPELSAIIDRASSFEKATATETPLTDSLAEHFPETLMFIGRMQGGDVLFFNTLPTTFTLYQERRDIFDHLSYVNITLFEKEKYTLGMLPKHSFEKDDSDIIEMLKAQGMNFSQSKDLITIRFKKKNQGLNVSALDSIDGKKLENAPCVIRTLNRTGKDGALCEYVFQGKVHWIDSAGKRALGSVSRTSRGGPVFPMQGDGLLVMRIPDDMWDKIPGMSGGSAVATIDGKEYLIGTNTERAKMLTSDSNGDVSPITMLVIQPVTKADLVAE